jgi:hypothetical protein
MTYKAGNADAGLVVLFVGQQKEYTTEWHPVPEAMLRIGLSWALQLWYTVCILLYIPVSCVLTSVT